jgi:hypothetical protein
MTTFIHRLIIPIVAVALLATVACQASKPEASTPSTSAPPAPPYTTTASIKDIMQHIVDPAGDMIWNSVATTVDSKDIHEMVPKTDEEWMMVRSGAIMLVEASNLLIMPGRHVARPGEKSETPGIELEPSEMEANINKDRAAWYQRAGKLHEIASKTLAVIDAKDAKGLFDVGAQIDEACENCHRQYWYPNEPVQPLTNEPDPKPAPKPAK